MAMRQFTVRQVVNGFIVEVGCMTFVFNSFKEMQEEIAAYHKDNDSVEKRWLGKAEEDNIRPGAPVEAEMPDAPPPMYRQPNVTGQRDMAQVALRGGSVGLDR